MFFATTTRIGLDFVTILNRILELTFKFKFKFRVGLWNGLLNLNLSLELDFGIGLWNWTLDSVLVLDCDNATINDNRDICRGESKVKYLK